MDSEEKSGGEVATGVEGDSVGKFRDGGGTEARGAGKLVRSAAKMLPALRSL